MKSSSQQSPLPPCPACAAPATDDETANAWICGSVVENQGEPDQVFVFTPMCEYAAHLRTGGGKERMRVLSIGERMLQGLYRDHGACMAADSMAMFLDVVRKGNPV